MNSLKLNKEWRLVLDAAGNIATVSNAERVAQDVASYERTFAGEPWYAMDEGIPYFNRQLGQLPQNELVAARANIRARQVPGVAKAQTRLEKFENRVLTGFIRITTEAGEVLNVPIQ